LNGIQRVEESISQHEWQLLDRHLKQLPSREPGLYRLSGGEVRISDRAHRIRDPILAVLILAAIVVPIVWAAIDKARGNRPPGPAAGMPPRPEWVSPVPNRPTQPERPEFQPRTSTYPRPTIPEGFQQSPGTGISPPMEFDFKVGDRVEVQVRREWQPATVLEVRNLSLRVRLEADNPLPERWVSVRRARRPAG
jgi:hypothetical protein